MKLIKQYDLKTRSTIFNLEITDTDMMVIDTDKYYDLLLKECDKTPVFTTCASEGTLIRIYSVLGQTSNGDPVTRWFISTHKQIDGVKIKWFKFSSR
jgi:hypothetical protein